MDSTLKNQLTYYYSKFDLFTDIDVVHILRFKKFKVQLKNYLGSDWFSYSSMLYCTQNGFLKGEEVFKLFLEKWFEVKNDVAYNPEELSVEYEPFIKELQLETNSFDIRLDLEKPLIVGFLCSAHEMWNQLNSIPEENSFKDVIVKPLIVASTKIMSYLGQTSKKLKLEGVEESESKVFASFTKSMSLDPQSASRKNSSGFLIKLIADPTNFLESSFKNLSLLETPALGSKRNRNSSNDSSVQIERFSEKFSKLISPRYLSLACAYIEKFIDRYEDKLVVAKGIVTNMVDINYSNLIKLEKKVSDAAYDVKDKVNLRFLQPATKFYNHLMKIWLVIKTSRDADNLAFPEYLGQVRNTMGSSWSERYLTPTEIFFETLKNEWSKMKFDENKDETLQVFIKKVRNNFLSIWESNIVKNIESFGGISRKSSLIDDSN